MEILEPGHSLHGFTVVSRTELPEYHGIGIRLQHAATGLDLFHLYNNDAENFFSFIFKTPPRNSTGAAHILEHSVLAGSKRFPVKDPFLELMKGSAQTFLNAMTYPDKTVYPAASPLKQDYFNLFEVYGDAVFFPLLRKEVFQQEGVRVVKGPGAKGHFSFDGIVFNEMRGVYSDHDSITAEWSHRSLFPDTPYGLDSGGNPLEIIKLSYEEFRGFHAEYYHPSNCRIFLYGDIPTVEQLRFLEEKFLKEFTAIKTDSTVAVPRPWTAPTHFSYTSPGLEDEPDSRTGSATINWLAGTALDPQDIMTLEILVETLLGNPGAPLYQAVIESGLGMDIASMSGMEADFREIVFTVGISGILPESAGKFEELIFRTLKDLVKNGIPREDVDAAVRRIEFQHRELRGGMPLGLRAMSRSLRGWLHGTDPTATLEFTPIMESLKKHLREDPCLLTDFISQRLVKNMHHSVVTVFPDSQHSDVNNGLIRKAAADLEAAASKVEIKRLADERKKLEEYYAHEDTPEALQTVPTLDLADMPRKVKTIAGENLTLQDVPVYRHTEFTNGIVYIDGAFDLSGLSADENRLIPLFSRLLYMTGLPGIPYNEVSRLLTRKTGGFFTFLDTATPIAGGGGDPCRHLFFRCKVLEGDAAEAFDLVWSLLGESQISDIRRIRDIILEQVSDYSSEIIPSGNAYAGLRASSRLRSAASIEEQWRGLDQLLFLQSLRAKSDQELKQLGIVLESIRRKVINRSRLNCSFTCGEEFQAPLEQLADRFLQQIPAGEPAGAEPAAAQPAGEQPAALEEPVFLPFESFITSTDVAFNAVVMEAPRVTEAGQSAYSILANLLTTNQLWEKIRVRGGAYGAHADINLLEGLFTLSSYRDPRIAGTYEDFSSALRVLSEGGFAAEQLEKSIISLISRDLRPLKPREQSMLGFRRKLYGIADELRQQRRDEYFTMTREQIMQAAAVLLDELEHGRSASVTITGKDMAAADESRLKWLREKATILKLQ